MVSDQETQSISHTPDKPNSDVSSYPWLASYPEDVNWEIDIEPQPVYGLLDHSAEKFGDNICTDFLGKCLTYKEIHGLTNRVAKGLQSLGIGKGKKVGIFLPNTPTFIIFYYAILKTGATVVNYNPLYTVEELEFQVKDSQTELMVTLDLKILFDKVEALLASDTLPKAVICPFKDLLPGMKSFLFGIFKGKELASPLQSAQKDRLVYFDGLIDNDGQISSPDIDLEGDIALLQYTGGTTGTPKGAMLSHANLSVNVFQVMAWAPEMIEGEERVMGILPFFHVFAMTAVMNYGIGMAAKIILMPKFELNQGLKLIHAQKPTIMPGVPTLYNAMMNHPKLSQYDLSSLKFCISGGAPLPIEVKREFERLTGCQLVEGYGLSETSPVASCNPTRGPVREGSIGLPVPQTIISIRSLEDPLEEVALGEKGELCIYGPQVMKGYWNKPEETENVFAGDFLRTGDVGYMDDEGFTYIVDRLKDLILCSGYNVYPRQIEEAIYQFPAVEEVTVIGIPDEYRGEAPKAFVKLKPGMSASVEDIFEFLKPKLNKIEMPEEIEFRDELPKTMIGKLSKKELRAES